MKMGSILLWIFQHLCLDSDSRTMSVAILDRKIIDRRALLILQGELLCYSSKKNSTICDK